VGNDWYIHIYISKSMRWVRIERGFANELV